MCKLMGRKQERRLQLLHRAGMMLSAAMLSLVVGCGGAKVVHVEADPSFDYSHAASAEIGIAGFVSIVGDDTQRASLRRQLPPLLAQSISKKRPDLNIISPERIQQALGEENHQSLLDQYVNGGALDQGSMAQLFSATQGLVRYVIMGRIEMDSFLRTEEREEDSTSPGTRYKTRRDMAVFLEVYDLEAGRSVFSGLITNDLTNSIWKPDVATTEVSSFGQVCADLFVSCLVSSIWSLFQTKEDTGGFPVPPSTEEITKDIFEKFAETLPAPEGS